MHPPLYLYEAVARGEVPRELLEEIEREHLKACCSVCAHTIAQDDVRRSRPGTPSWEPPRDRLEPLRDRMRQADLNVRTLERDARAWVRRAVKLPREVRRDKVTAAYVRYKGPLFCQLLLEEARRRIPGDPAEAESLADAALAANRETAVYQSDPEVEAAGLAVRGNARRALGRLVVAANDLARAKRLLDLPDVKDPETPAEVFSYLGSLRTNQGRFDEAAGHMHRAATLDRGIAWDAGLVGLELALVHLVRGRTAQVRKLAHEALKIFAEQEVEREVRAALDLLDAAARRDAFTRELLEQAITAVERASHGRPAAVQQPR